MPPGPGPTLLALAAVSGLDPALPIHDVALRDERLALRERGSRVLRAKNSGDRRPPGARHGE